MIAALSLGTTAGLFAQDLCSQLSSLQQSAGSGFESEKGTYDAKYRDGSWDAKTKIKGTTKCYIEETNLQYVAVVYSGTNLAEAKKLYNQWVAKTRACVGSYKSWEFNNIGESEYTTYFSEGSEKLGNEPVNAYGGKNGEGDRLPKGKTIVVDLLPINKDLNSGTGARTWEVRVRVYQAQ